MKLPPAISAVVLAAAAACSLAEVPNPDAPEPRIVSFSPALTQILFDMRMGDCVVGVTQFCRLPAGVQRPRVGSALTINAEAILKVRPDIILAQTDPAKFKGVVDIDPAVRVVRVPLERLADVTVAIESIGRLTGRPARARQQGSAFAAELDFVARLVAGRPRPRVIFVMGTDRPTAAGADNFVADLIALAGGANAGADIPGMTRWRRTHIDAITQAAPDVLICQVSPGQEQAAREYWLQWKDLPAAKSGRVHVVSDANWTIPSTRLAELSLELAGMIHPELVAGADAAAPAVGATMPLWLARFYRLLAAAIVGAALAAAGAALQGLLRNPLAEPYVLGISSGAGVGVLFGMALAGQAAVPTWASTPVLAFIGALMTCAVVYAVAQRRGRLDPYSLILTGVIVNCFNAAIMLTIYLYIDPHRIADFAYWSMGRVGDSIDVLLLSVCGACVLVGWAVLFLRSAAFNVLGLGDEVAASSGVSVHLLRVVTFVAVGLMTAAAVALAGPIAFLGLIVPHVCRLVVGPEHRRLILVSGIAGAAFLMAADTLCRSAGAWIGVSLIPVGIITALCGGPFFLLLLRRRLKEAPA